MSITTSIQTYAACVQVSRALLDDHPIDLPGAIWTLWRIGEQQGWRCAAPRRDGLQCGRHWKFAHAVNDVGYCWQHDPRRAA